MCEYKEEIKIKKLKKRIPKQRGLEKLQSKDKRIRENRGKKEIKNAIERNGQEN